jgi:hypothetical protein
MKIVIFFKKDRSQMPVGSWQVAAFANGNPLPATANCHLLTMIRISPK